MFADCPLGKLDCFTCVFSEPGCTFYSWKPKYGDR
jgi:hypothetical protein